jgi:hypothetical protein
MTTYPYVSRAQRSVSKANGALQNRDRRKLGVWNGPGSAVHRFALHRVRDTSAQRALFASFAASALST